MKIFCSCVLFTIISIKTWSQLPEFKATVYDSSSTTGYYFISNLEYLMILDKYGSVIYYKPVKTLSNFMLQPNGIMSYDVITKFFLMDSTFKVVDSVACKNVDMTNYHDLRILPDGHFLMIGTDSLRMNLSGHSFWKEKSGNNINAIVKFSVIQEQDAKKNVVFEWQAKDHYAIDDVDTFFLARPPFFDWTHINAIEMDHDGNILLSCRNLDEITKISRSDGSIIWRLGGKHNQFKFVNCPVPFYGQHDVRRIANGHITLFDNGYHATPHGARAMEFELDEKKKIATLKWSFTNDSTSVTRQGNVQRLGNSNTLINYGNSAGSADSALTFVVVHNDGSKIFQLGGINSYRVFNYPDLPWQLHRPQITCYDSLGVSYLDAGEGYKSYSWNDSSTTRSIAITKPGAYYVFVPYGEGGFISSEKFIVADVSRPCEILPAKPKRKSKSMGNK